LALLIDEFASMATKVFSGENLLAVEIAEFIQEYLRNSNILLTIAHQSIEQLDEQLRQTLLSLGTYLFARPATKPEARILADALFDKNPYWTKHVRETWEEEQRTHWVKFGNGYSRETTKQWVLREWEPVAYLSLEDQQELFAQRLTRLGVMQFMCRPALSEGEVGREIYPLTIADIDRDEYPDQQQIADVCSSFAVHSGIPVETRRMEQEGRVRAIPTHRAAPPAPNGRESQPSSQPAPGTGNATSQLPPKRIQRRHRPGKQGE
jgi:hypothetical protein